MNIRDELTLSYYKEIGVLNASHEVFLVQNQQTGRLYVKKTLDVFSADVYDYLLQHPITNTPKIYEVIRDDNRLIVIEEYINGTSLQKVVEGKHFSQQEAVSFMTKLCRIVLDLHQCTPPIVHRDIKPSNIIITEDGAVKLLDMNAAKQYLGDSEQDTQLIGTAGYAAPEQYGFGSSSIHTDMYALGVLMATIVYGSFSRHSLSGSAYDRIIEKCTRIDPKTRYASVKDIIDDLSLILSDNEAKRQKRYLPQLPPGFRSLRPVRMILAGLGYIFLILMASTLSVEKAVGVELWMNRLFFFLACLGAILILGNYMDVWDKIGLTRIKSKVIRYTLALICAAVWFVLMVLLLIIAINFIVAK